MKGKERERRKDGEEREIKGALKQKTYLIGVCTFSAIYILRAVAKTCQGPATDGPVLT